MAMKSADNKSTDLGNSISKTEQTQLTLLDSDIKVSRVDRRSFLTRAMIAGTIGVSAALTAACPSGSSDGTDSDSDSQ